MAYETIKYEVAEQILTITLNRDLTSSMPSTAPCRRN